MPRTGSPPSFGGNPVRGIHWLPDGEHFLQTKKGTLYKVHAASGRSEPFVDTAKLAAALAKVPSLDRQTAQTIARGTRRGRDPQAVPYQMNPQATGFLFEHADDLYFAMFDGSQAVRLTKTPAKEELASFSPDGKWIAFVREQNLYVVDIATQTEPQLTVDGGRTIATGTAHWLYSEELL